MFLSHYDHLDLIATATLIVSYYNLYISFMIPLLDFEILVPYQLFPLSLS